MATAKRNRNTANLFVRVHFTGGERFGPGKAELLRAIGETGSISQAARSMRMSYRRAWLLVDSTNKLFGRPVVAAATGGRAGGGASLTPFGQEVLRDYRQMVAAIERAAAPCLRRLTRKVAAAA